MHILRSLIILTGILISSACFSQSNIQRVKTFDYSVIEGKTLWIPKFENIEFLIKSVAEPKYFKDHDIKEYGEKYDQAWAEAIKESGYKATDYVIKSYDANEELDNKDSDAIILYYTKDGEDNWFIQLAVTKPKKTIIARTLVNRLDFTSKNTVRLVINMLNESLLTYSSLGDDASAIQMNKKIKSDFLNYYNSIDSKTFLVPLFEGKNADKENVKLKETMKDWTLSKYKIIDEKEIEKRRNEGDSTSFFWYAIPVYQGAMVLYYNLLVSTLDDNVIHAFLGKKEMKSSTIKKIEKELDTKSTQYKKVLE